ncbi:MAG: choice-of-anchor B family protein [Bacteroidota bacterium]
MNIPNFLLVFGCFLSSSFSLSAQLNIELFGQFNRGDARYSGSWTYVDVENRREYALLGTRVGTAVYNIDALPITEVGFVAGLPSNWREITVLGDYAYVTTEGKGTGAGMQIIDLSPLPDSVMLVNTYIETFTTGHILQRDITTEAPFLYVMGTCGNCGVQILEVSDPVHPVEIGAYNPGYYIHDAHVRGDYLYAAAFFEGTIDIVDIRDKSNPTLIAQIDDPGGSTHSAWTSIDERFLIISGEKDGLPARVWNIEDLDNLYEVATYSHNVESLTHNPYVRGDFVFFAHNTEGLTVVDIADPTVPVEVGYYDTFDGPSGGFKGLWSACPYLPSGKIVGGNREDGLYVWMFNDAKAGRFYVTLLDESTQEIIKNGNGFVQKMDVSIAADLRGIVKFGALSGNFRVDFSAEGYETKTVDIRLAPSDSLSLQISLVPKSVGLFNVKKEFPTIKTAPNPLKDFTVLDLNDLPKARHLRIFNALGQLERSEQVVGSQFFVLEKGYLTTGIYLLAVYDDNQRLLAQRKLAVD